jgi:hypothetical protein
MAIGRNDDQGHNYYKTLFESLISNLVAGANFA